LPFGSSKGDNDYTKEFDRPPRSRSLKALQVQLILYCVPAFPHFNTLNFIVIDG
jgi:hypothetical protein